VKHVQEALPEASTVAICRALGVPRSSFYFRSTKRDDSAAKKAVEETAAAFPRFGYEGLTGQMRFEGRTDAAGKPIGERRVRRLVRELGLSRKPAARKVRTTNSEHALPRYENLVKDKTASRPDEIWASDITYIRLGSGFVYLAVVLDTFTRCVRGWHLSRRIDGSLALAALRKATSTGRAPAIHHSDQGVQYAAKEYVAHLVARGSRLSMASVGCPEENGFAERWMRTLKDEHVSLSEYENLEDARAQIEVFIEEVYQRKRAHSSIGYLPPAIFEERLQAPHPKAQNPKARNGEDSPKT
jgi:putative transposase